jgi:hypothetical protein
MNIPDWLTISADSASLLSLSFTGVIWYQTREIKKSVVSRARLPESLSDLKKYKNQLLPYLREWPGFETEANSVVAKIDAVLRNLRSKLDGSEKKQISKLVVLIARRNAFWFGWENRDDNFRANMMWNIHEQLEGAIELLEQLKKDVRKRV